MMSAVIKFLLLLQFCGSEKFSCLSSVSSLFAKMHYVQGMSASYVAPCDTLSMLSLDILFVAF